MRNKVFAVIGVVIFLAFFVGAPLFLFLTRAEVLPYENVGNQVTAEKEYEEDHPLYGVLTAIEEVKVAVKDTYINHLPGFLKITNVFKPLKAKLDRPVIDFFAIRGRDLMASARPDDDSEEKIPPTRTEEEIPPVYIEGVDPPTTVKDPDDTKYSASLVSKSAMFRIYHLVATYPDGTTDESYVRVIAHDRDALYQNMLEMSDTIEEMMEVRPEVNWYFSFATNLEATELCDKFFPEESVRYIYEEFLQGLPEDAQATNVAVNSFRDYADKFYMTDHHWNHVGVSEAYYNILSMLRVNYDDVEPMSLNSLHVFEGVKFYGSLARSNASYDLYDQFGLYYYDLPPHTLTIDPAITYGSKATLPENVSRYLAGQYVTTKGYNHYTEFYRVPMKIEYPENNTGRRLLIIGDSYSLPLLELVAANFDVTYVRYEDRGWNALPDNLYIDEFVDENGITDVLVIEDIVKSIMKGYGTHYPSGFLNIYPSLEYTPYKKED